MLPSGSNTYSSDIFRQVYFTIRLKHLTSFTLRNRLSKSNRKCFKHLKYRQYENWIIILFMFRSLQYKLNIFSGMKCPIVCLNLHTRKHCEYVTAFQAFIRWQWMKLVGLEFVLELSWNAWKRSSMELEITKW